MLDGAPLADGSSSADAFVVSGSVTKRAAMSGLVIGLLASAPSASALVTLGLGPTTLRVGETAVAADTTLNAHVVMAAGATFNVASGKTLTITGSLQAPLARIFTGAGTVRLAGPQDAVFGQWWGAVGDGLTNDRAAIQAAIDCVSARGFGRVRLPSPSPYYNVTSTGGAPCLTLTHSNVAIEGDGSETTQLLSTSPDGDLLQITGSTGSYLSRINLKGLTLGRTVLPTLGSDNHSLKAYCTVWLNVQDVIAHTSVTQLYLENCKSANIQKVTALRTGASRSPDDYYTGVRLKGSNYTIRLKDVRSLANASDSSIAYTGPSYGFLADGTDLRDIWLEECQADLSQYGYQIDGEFTASSGTNQNWDIHFRGCTTDSFGTTGFNLMNLTGFAMVSIEGGWTNPGTGGMATTGVRLDSVWNASITAVKNFGTGNTAMHTGIWATRVSNVVIEGNTVNGAGRGIVLDGTTAGGYAVNCAVTGNSIFNANPSVPTTTGISLKSANGNTITSNVLSSSGGGGMTTGIALDSGSNNNAIGLNTFGAVPTKITIAGTGNRLVGNPGVADA